MVALRRDEQRRNAVAVESRRLVLPLAHHGEQPRLEPLVPERCVGGHGAGEVADMVVPVPSAFARGKIFADGVELTHVVGLDIVAYVVWTHLDTLALHLKDDATEHARVERSETVGRQRDGAILCAAQDGVVAEGVAHGEKADHAVDGT